MQVAHKKRHQFCVWLTLILVMIAAPLWATHWFSSRTALFELAEEVSWPDRGDWNALSDPNSLNFSPETRLSESQLRMIAGFEGLDRLTIGGVSETDLELLRGLKGLHALTLTNTSISDQVLKIISEFPILHELRISEATDRSSRGQVTATGMNDLGSMIGLRILTMNCPQLTDENIAPLSGCISLEALDLASQNIHGSGLKHLQSLSQLRDLRLDGCTLDDESGLRSLTQNAALRRVWLRSCGDLNESIPAVATMAQLERLHLEGSDVTDAAIIQLRSACPELWIFDASGRLWSPNSDEPQMIR